MARARLMKKEKIFIDELAEKGGRPLYELTPAAARPTCRAAGRRMLRIRLRRGRKLKPSTGGR